MNLLCHFLDDEARSLGLNVTRLRLIDRLRIPINASTAGQQAIACRSLFRTVRLLTAMSISSGNGGTYWHLPWLLIRWYAAFNNRNPLHSDRLLEK